MALVCAKGSWKPHTRTMALSIVWRDALQPALALTQTHRVRLPYLLTRLNRYWPIIITGLPRWDCAKTGFKSENTIFFSTWPKILNKKYWFSVHRYIGTDTKYATKLDFIERCPPDHFRKIRFTLMLLVNVVFI